MKIKITIVVALSLLVIAIAVGLIFEQQKEMRLSQFGDLESERLG